MVVQVRCQRASWLDIWFCSHKLDGVSARRAALQAPRGDDHPQRYYEDISDVDSVLDVLQELTDADQMESNAVMDAFDISAFDVQVGNVTAGEPFGDGAVVDVPGKWRYVWWRSG